MLKDLACDSTYIEKIREDCGYSPHRNGLGLRLLIPSKRLVGFDIKDIKDEVTLS
ncbi:hypothetical protein GCM10027286_04200 [Virgibacillus ainsalahensis]